MSPRNDSPEKGAFMDGKKHEVWALCLLIATLLVFFSLFSFDSRDPYFFDSSSARQAANLIGIFGATLAKSLLFLFGPGACAIPFAGLWLSWSLLRGNVVFPRGRTQMIGAAFLVISFAGLAALLALPDTGILVHGREIPTESLLGSNLALFLQAKLSFLGAFILLSGVICISLLLTTPLSLRAFFGFLTILLRGVFGFLKMLLASTARMVKGIFERRRQARDARERTAPASASTPPEIPEEKRSRPLKNRVGAAPGNGGGTAFPDDFPPESPEEPEIMVGDNAESLLSDDPRLTLRRGAGAGGPEEAGPKRGNGARAALSSDAGAAPGNGRAGAGLPERPLAEGNGKGRAVPAATPGAADREELLAPPAAPAFKAARKESTPEDYSVFTAGAVSVKDGYELPSLQLLDAYEEGNHGPDRKTLEENARILEGKLANFGVEGKVADTCPGPVITMYEYVPAPGIKISRIVSLSDDLAMALRAISIRVVAPIPGKAAIGIEVPNRERELVSIRAVLEDSSFTSSTAALTIALGKDTAGRPAVANLAKMPHLLIAGATGTGKSVGINAILSSLLFRNTPDELRLLLIDPKRIELSSYEGIPHLIHPVVTDAKLATRALRWAVLEMELRYKLLAAKGARNIVDYNKTVARDALRAEDGGGSGTDPGAGDPELVHRHLPYVVIIIDELADLMMVASKEVEESIMRLAQMARAAGLHLILATQRPSVDVLTGVIKANIPTRLSFQVSSRIDSRTILDSMGAENLLGSGDMLFVPPGTAKMQRIHGAYVSEAEVRKLTRFWSAQQLREDPLRERVNFQDSSPVDEEGEGTVDVKYDDAIRYAVQVGEISISKIQRGLQVGYNRAARMFEMMEKQGIIEASDGTPKPRKVLISKTAV
jgi:S-DNA-T family DNA segregation ATPase FtsK/SpoIIIE